MKLKAIKLQENINLSTTYRWMRSLGYKFCKQAKCYYADAHECPDVVRYRRTFDCHYLDEYELYMMRWVQIPLMALRSIFTSKKIYAD
eukprot:12298241-Ditylum_brightwellii.AAC.1